MTKEKNNCTLVIAGPGSGKTYNMVKRALECLPDLNPHRFMALITYTNAATEKIKEKLQEVIRIPPNIFIGTIHSFMNQFILKPYGKVFELLPNDYFIIDEFDFSFLDGKRFPTPLDRRIYEKAIENKKFSKGIVTYNQIESKAASLLDAEKSTIRKALGNRLQFLFVDEMQDATLTQYQIFDNLRKEGRTNIYCIGDPEQYIYGFTYNEKGKKALEFNKIPIKRFQCNKKIIQESISDDEVNRRSTSKIVRFLNNFRLPHQEVGPIHAEDPDIIFINRKEINEIVTIFNTLCDKLLSKAVKENLDYCKFFLSYQNDTFAPVYSTCSMEKISNDDVRPRSILRMATDYILAVSGRPQTDILQECNISLMELRKIGVSVLHLIKNNPDLREVTLKKHIKDKLCANFNRENQKTKNSFENLVSSFKVFGSSENKSSSIHKAKGLEASAVIALAETQKRLSKWLETDQGVRVKDKIDECRIGFVAFSRAKYFLSIACLENVDEEILTKLRNLNVTII
jgi:DNA helicase-2/ATP-dependent DNA helicase PcrA